MGQAMSQRMFARAVFGCALSAALLSGCVKRSIIVDTDPPGAELWINGHPMGKTPVTYAFITHGRYKFEIQKAGFQPLTVREMVKAPMYEWIPVDFLFEFFVPVHLEDKHSFLYKLATQSAEEKLELETPANRESLLAGLKSPNPVKRREAIAILAARRDPQDDSLFKEMMKDADPRVRAVALSGIRSVEGAASRDFLLETMRSDPAREVRWQAAAELEVLKDPKSLPGLLEALKDRDPMVRTGAAEALRAVPNPSIVLPLIRSLRESDAGVRRAAVEALGQTKDKRALAPLTRALFHHDVRTRRQAALTLAFMRDPSCGPAFVKTFTDWDPVVRRIAVKALIDFCDERVVPTLIRRLHAFRPWTREHAAQVLGGLRDHRAIQPLKIALSRELDPPARAAMKDALAKMPP